MKPTILTKKEIERLIDKKELMKAIEKGFIAFSKGSVQSPNIQDFHIEKYKGETDIKSAYIKDGKHICVKIASNFFNNNKLGLSSAQGLMILLDATNGTTKAVLFDEGALTSHRTAAAGTIAAKHLAKKQAKNALVIGTGIQAKLQTEYLNEVRKLKNIWIHGRNKKKAEIAKKELQKRIKTAKIQVITNLDEIKEQVDIIITTTPSKKAIIKEKHVNQGVHITAIGSDSPEKQEIDEKVLKKAKIIVDSKAQCIKRGETFHAIKKGVIKKNNIHAELGEVLAKTKKGRKNDKEITLFDATGLGVQDLVAAEYILKKYKRR